MFGDDFDDYEELYELLKDNNRVLNFSLLSYLTIPAIRFYYDDYMNSIENIDMYLIDEIDIEIDYYKYDNLNDKCPKCKSISIYKVKYHNEYCCDVCDYSSSFDLLGWNIR